MVAVCCWFILGLSLSHTHTQVAARGQELGQVSLPVEELIIEQAAELICFLFEPHTLSADVLKQDYNDLIVTHCQCFNKTTGYSALSVQLLTSSKCWR